MPQPSFYELSSPESTRKCAEWVHDEMQVERIVCTLGSDGHRRGGKRLTDLSVTLPRGAVQDFVWTWYSECLIQDRVLTILRDNNLSGFDVKPVKARFKDSDPGSQPPAKLWELVLTGWAGLASAESGIRLREFCDGCSYAVYTGLQSPEKLINVASWDGSDFFMVWPMPNYVFVTDRVVDVIRKNKFTGVKIRAANDLQTTEGHIPGRLSHSMPEDLARERALVSGIAEV